MGDGRPWSKLKARVEALWEPALRLSIHCTSYPFNTPGAPVRVSRHWIALNKAIVWDFPGPFLADPPARGRKTPTGDRHFANGGSIVGELLRAYLDRPREALFEPFGDDHWELTDMLRAADRRIGHARLATWARDLDDGHPAWPVLGARAGLAPKPAAARSGG